MKIITNKEKIEEIVIRGVERNFPNDDFLRSKLLEGKQLKIYLGIDPTGPTLHMGHVIPLKKLAQLQKLGHKVILLIGDFTATIGDPDKTSVREPLTKEKVLENQKLYKKQVSIFLDFYGENPAEFVYNSNWLGKMNFADVLELASKMSVQQMLERDMFKKRIKEEKPIYIHEFMYPLMQGYDSVVMDVDGEVGGNDQTFNMLAGRHLMKENSGKEKFVIPMKLLVDSAGAKMGKTTGNMLSFLDSVDEKFGKIMSWSDEMILPGYELLTDKNLEEISEKLNNTDNPKDIKMDLALEITTIFDGEKNAQKAKENWTKQFSKKTIPDNLKEFSFKDETEILEILKEVEFVKSKGEAKRKIEEGAVKILSGDGFKNEDKVLDYSEKIKSGKKILKLGKKMVKIILE